jgi:hypothetical protein
MRRRRAGAVLTVVQRLRKLSIFFSPTSPYNVFRFFNTCPSTDPADVYFFPILGYNHLISPECTSLLGFSPNCATAPYNFTLSPGSGSNNQFFDAETIPKNGSDPLMNSPGGLATPVSGGIFTWSFYEDGVATVNATVTTWSGPGATTLGTGKGSVTSASKRTGTLGASSTVSPTPTSSVKSNGWETRWENSPSVGLLFLGSCVLHFVM